jgi:hypothetical protein
VNPVELVFAAVFAALGVRSAVYWARHRLETQDAADELLFAAFVTGRVGTWLLAAGMFVLFGTISAHGQGYTDEARQYSWLFIVFLALGALQLIASWFLGVRDSRDAEEDEEAGNMPRPPTA